jgi:tetratricopeptide (TPR) repeat protein
VENQHKEGTFHLALCWVRINQDRFDDARLEANEAVRILRPTEGWDGVAVAYRHLGLIEKLLGEFHPEEARAKEHFDRSLEYNKASLDIWRELDNQREISSVLANIGHLYFAQERFPEARDYLEQALELLHQAKDISRMSTNLIRLGDIYREEGEFDSAADYYREALDIAERVGDIEGVGKAKVGLARIAQKGKRQKEAQRLAIEALEHFQSLNETAFLRKEIKKAQALIGELGGRNSDAFASQRLSIATES